MHGVVQGQAFGALIDCKPWNVEDAVPYKC